MEKIQRFPKPTYITSDASGYYRSEVKKDRFQIKYTYLFLDQLIMTKKQSNGRFEDDGMYFEYLLN